MTQKSCMTCGVSGCDYNDTRRCASGMSLWEPKTPKVERDCNTCANHVQAASLDDQPVVCWSCSSASVAGPKPLPYWKPMSKSYDAAFRDEAPLRPLESIRQEPPKASAPELLNKAADLLTERGKQYDQPEGERSMSKAVSAFNAITGRNLSESEGWLLLQVLKDVRLFQKPGYHQDSAEDCIAYASLKAESKQAEKA